MNRDDLVAALTGHRPGAEVQVDVMGFLIDVTAIIFDDRRDAIVIELVAEDVDDALTRSPTAGCIVGRGTFVVTGPAQAGSGNSL
jgi:hypothetical protein